MENIKDVIGAIKEIGVDGWEAIKTIGKFFNYLMHPSLIFQALWNFLDVYSLWICMCIAIFSLILYGLGAKKYAKYVPISIAAYSLIKVIGSAF